MKQIVNKLPREVELITINEMFRDTVNNKQAVIAYVTRNNTGMCISTQLDNGDYGFRYHSDLIKPYTLHRRQAKYIADTKTASMQKVIDADRELLMFDDFKEFVKFAANHTDLKL